MEWIGQYIVDKFFGKPNVKIIHLGDHWHMDSLSSYDRGKRQAEGRRIVADIQAGNEAFALLNRPLEELNEKRRRRKQSQWWPERYFLIGNHEDRIMRTVEEWAALEGLLDYNLLDFRGWTVIPYLQPIELDGVLYAHYFYNPQTGRPYSGMPETRLKNIGHSFTMGHQQGYRQAVMSFCGVRRRALIVGSCYVEGESYRGPQAQDEWRGIIVCHEVQNGDYDLMEVSLNYLSRRYGGRELHEWVA
ncbi:MAG: hypothetical protein IRZ06_12680 [Nevskia sp.]|nr:hypothetical protein [Nevskia sp.]